MTSTSVRAAVGPLLVVAVAAALWLVSDRLVQIGPLDRAAFGWSMVIPLWVLAPAAGAIAARVIEDDVGSGPALISGVVVGAITAALLWFPTVNVDCSPTRTPLELAVPALTCGFIVGSAFAFACRIATGQMAGGHPWRALAMGSIPQLLTLAIVPVLGSFWFFGLCQRPQAG